MPRLIAISFSLALTAPALTACVIAAPPQPGPSVYYVPGTVAPPGAVAEWRYVPEWRYR